MTLEFLTHLKTICLSLLVALTFQIIGWVQHFPVHSYAIASHSMSPNLNQGDLILTVRQTNYQVGDVVTYRLLKADSSPTTHRIVQVVEDGDEYFYRTRGDANPSEDGLWISQAQIQGKAFMAIPWLGRVSLWWANFPSKVFAIMETQTHVQAVTFSVADHESQLQLLVDGEQITEQIENPELLQNLGGWSMNGNFEWLSEANGRQGVIVLSQGSLQQQLPDISTKYLSLWLRLESSEQLAGFDEPTYEVLLNQHPVFHGHWSESTSDWQQLVIRVEDSPVHSLEIIVNNTGDEAYPPRLFLDQITTTVPVIRPQSAVQLRSRKGEILQYQVNQQPIAYVNSHADFHLSTNDTQLNLQYGQQSLTNSQTLIHVPSFNQSNWSVTSHLNPDSSMTLMLKVVHPTPLIIMQNLRFRLETAEQVPVPIIETNYWWDKSGTEVNQGIVLTTQPISRQSAWLSMQLIDAAGNYSAAQIINWPAS